MPSPTPHPNKPAPITPKHNFPLIPVYLLVTSHSLVHSAGSFAGCQPLQVSITWPWSCGFPCSSGGNTGSFGIPCISETQGITRTMPRFTPKPAQTLVLGTAGCLKSHFPQLSKGQRAAHSLKRCFGTAEQLILEHTAGKKQSPGHIGFICQPRLSLPRPAKEL